MPSNKKLELKAVRDMVDVYIANCVINDAAGMSRKVFLEKLAHVRSIRTDFITAFSLFPTTEASWTAIDKFHVIVENGDFGDGDFPYSDLRPNAKVFGVYIPLQLYEWFANTSLTTIKKQIALYSATVYHYFMGDDRPQNIFPPLFNELQRIIKKYYESNEDDLDETYKRAAHDYYHSLVPPLLSIESFCDRVQKALYKGCHDNIQIRSAYFSADDWNHHVLHKTTRYILWRDFEEKKGPKPTEENYNSLVNIPESYLNNIYEDKGPESDEDTWSKWLLTFRKYPITKSHLYSFYDEDGGSGYVYIARAGMSNHYKIGFTENSDIDKRLSAHQTSSHEKIERVGAFPVSSIKTEKTIHKKFYHKKIRGEWFELSDEEVRNLLCPDWRKKNNIF